MTTTFYLVFLMSPKFFFVSLSVSKFISLFGSLPLTQYFLIQSKFSQMSHCLEITRPRDCHKNVKRPIQISYYIYAVFGNSSRTAVTWKMLQNVMVQCHSESLELSFLKYIVAKMNHVWTKRFWIFEM